MITVRKYFPGFALPWDASEFEETKCATPKDVLNCHCWRDRVGDKKLQYPDNEEISTNVIFFDQGWGSIVALSDTVEEMKALIELAGIEPGHWWSDKEE